MNHALFVIKNWDDVKYFTEMIVLVLPQKYINKDDEIAKWNDLKLKKREAIWVC